MAEHPRQTTHAGHARAGLVLAISVGVLGAAHAARLAWLCDDAYISMRYAENFAGGRGLVFNVGERVEGFTNLLWTLWISVGAALGISLEAWATYSGVVAFGVACALLGWIEVRAPTPESQKPAWGRLPWAGLVLAVAPDAAIWGTSGLETSALLASLLGAYALATRPVSLGGPNIVAAGVTTALASAVRPDAILLAPWLALALSWAAPASETWRERLRPAVVYGIAVTLPWLVINFGRTAYYGDFFPNTYYAKSANLAHWSQGASYLQSYYRRYGVQLIAVAFVIYAWFRRLADRDTRSSKKPQAPPRPVDEAPIAATVALGFALTYTVYVAKVGGGFMYARLLLPTMPFVLLGLTSGGRPPWLQPVAAAPILLVPWLIEPFPGGTLKHRGIVDEHHYFTRPDAAATWTQRTELVTAYLSGTNARVAFTGTYARAVWAARLDPAIEAETGLTDATIAHQSVTQRRRPGHEKRADPYYLADERKVHFVIDAPGATLLDLDEVVPRLVVTLPDARGPEYEGLDLAIVRWDPEIMAELEARGAWVPDIEARLRRFRRAMQPLPRDLCLAQADRLSRLYYDQVAGAEDPASWCGP